MSKLNFERDERILCFHGPLVYEAKIMKVEVWDQQNTPNVDSGPHYFVHYKGWKQTWDEWVPESRILKFNEANLQRQKDLNSTYSRKKEEKSRMNKLDAVDSVNGGPVIATSGAGGGRKRARDITGDKEEDYLKRPELRIPIPDGLKIQLVDDWEYVTKHQRLVSLPREPTVAQILDDYRSLKVSKVGRNREAPNEDVLNEVLAGLKLYFDKALGNILLYRFERQQYADVRKRYPDRAMSDIYGAEHLLRLFVQLPMLIAHTAMDQESVMMLKEHLNQILIYMQKAQDKLFIKEYENAPPEYLHG